MKNCYFAATVEKLENGEPKYYDYVIKATTSDNILSLLEQHGAGETATKGRLISVNYCETKKQAAELVTCWRQCHKENGTALFNGRF